MSIEIIVALGLLVFVYALMTVNLVHRTVVAMLGAGLGAIALIILGKAPTFEGLVDHISFETLGLLMGMMIIVGIMGESGIFRRMSYHLFRLCRGSPALIFILLILATALMSAFLDNVTTLLIVAPITIDIARLIKISPTRFLIAEVLSSNIGGAATLIGDPPNIMVGSVFSLGFLEFIYNLAPIILIILGVNLLLWYIPERKNLRKIKSCPIPSRYRKPVNRRILIRSSVVLMLVIAMFFLEDLLGVSSAAIALAGATILLLLTGIDIYDALSNVEWPTLLFFAGLFIFVGTLEELGLITAIGKEIINISGGSLSLLIVLILWVSAFASAFIDNIPYTATMIPVVGYLSTTMGYPLEPLAWALVLGACLGGNGTLVGASANVVMAGIAEREGVKVDFLGFMKIGLPTMVVSMLLSTAYLLLRFT
ncbi:MAG: ArsB/NhaD family transporter [Thermoplasmata archaeon]|nr:ArsB/NhaD family transporter [Thermoplasmata archaeon]